MKAIAKSTQVPLSCGEAFDLFIKDLDIWWPKNSHAPLGPDVSLIVEPHKDGKIIERTTDGKENHWGRIIAWQPGEFLSFSWFPDCTEDDATIVAISFEATDVGTRLDLTHGDFGILGKPVDAISQSYLFGWDLVLGSYCFAATRYKIYA